MYCEVVCTDIICHLVSDTFLRYLSPNVMSDHDSRRKAMTVTAPFQGGSTGSNPVGGTNKHGGCSHPAQTQGSKRGAGARHAVDTRSVMAQRSADATQSPTIGGSMTYQPPVEPSTWQQPPPPAGWQPPAAQYPQGPPPYYPAPGAQHAYGGPPKPKRHRFRNFVVFPVAGLIVLIIIISIATSAGSKSKTPSTPATAGTAVHTSSLASPGISKGLGANNAAGDITLGAVTTDAAGITHVALSVLNHSSKRSDYFVTLAMQSADGKTQYDTTIGSAQDVEPGQTATIDAVFFNTNPFPAGAVPVIKEVQRTESS